MTTSKQQQKSTPIQREERRVAIVGGGAVGKSSITVAFVKHEFVEEYDPTIEDSYTNQIRVDDRVCLTHIIDTAGQDEYKSLRSQYMKDAEGFILVFDVTSRDSLNNLVEFIGDIGRYRESDKFPCVLVGNKSDLKAEYCFSQNLREEVNEFKQRYLHDCPYVETSALQRLNIDLLFQTIVRLIRKEVEGSSKNNLGATKPARKSSLFGSLSHAQDEKADLDKIQDFL